MEDDPFDSARDEDRGKDVDNGEFFLAMLDIEISRELERTIDSLKQAIVDPEIDPEAVRSMWVEYALRFEALAEGTDSPEKYEKTQIAAIIYKALIFRDVGKGLRYLEELDKAEMLSANSGFVELSALISAEIDSRTQELDESPERLILLLRGKVSDANRAQMWDLWADEQDYEDLVNHAFEMLLDDGEDPREVLTKLGVFDDSRPD